MQENQRTRFEAAMDKRDALKTAEAAGQVADSKTMRKAVRAAERAHGITASGTQEQR